MKVFHIALLFAPIVLADNGPDMEHPVVRPASSAILGGKPAPSNGIDLIGEQCRNLGDCFEIFKTIHAKNSQDLLSLVNDLASTVKSCMPQFAECTKHLQGFIEDVKADRGIPADAPIEDVDDTPPMAF